MNKMSRESGKEVEVKYFTPRNVNNYMFETIVFFPEESKPKVIFHSLNPTRAYEEAQKTYKATGKLPTVMTVTATQVGLQKYSLK